MAIDEDSICDMLSSEQTRQRAFEMMVKLYSEPLYWKVRHIVFSHDDANDVLQNTFMKAWRSIGSFQRKSKLLTWLCSIAINESLDYVKKSRANMNVGMADGASVSQSLMADEYFDGDEAHALLLEAVAALPDVQRTVFTLRYFDDMKYSDMSQALDTSEGALKASYHIAVKKISSYLRLNE